MQNSDLTAIDHNKETFERNFDVFSFKKNHQLFKKGERFNFILQGYDFKTFAYQFLSYRIENLHLIFEDDSQTFTITEYNSKFEYLFDADLTDDSVILNFSGYFKELDFYFYTKAQHLMLDYIDKNKLQLVLDQLFEHIPCEFRNRLITQLIIDIKFL